jgi:hypothetical protein
MTFCAEFRIEVPDSFPLEAWDKFLNFGRQAIAGHNDPGGDYIRAMGCVVYRFRACREAIDSMIAYWHRSGRTLSGEGYYLVERDLFNFFTCGLSVIESLFYGVYMVATQKYPSALDWSNVDDRKWKARPHNI